MIGQKFTLPIVAVLSIAFCLQQWNTVAATSTTTKPSEFESADTNVTNANQGRKLSQKFGVGTFIPLGSKLFSLPPRTTLTIRTTVVAKTSEYVTVYPTCLKLRTIRSICHGPIKTILPTASVSQLSTTEPTESDISDTPDINQNEIKKLVISPSSTAPIQPTRIAGPSAKTFFDASEDDEYEYQYPSDVVYNSATEHLNRIPLSNPLFQGGNGIPLSNPPFQGGNRIPLSNPVCQGGNGIPLSNPPFPGGNEIPVLNPLFQEANQMPLLHPLFQGTNEMPVLNPLLQGTVYETVTETFTYTHYLKSTDHQYTVTLAPDYCLPPVPEHTICYDDGRILPTASHEPSQKTSEAVKQTVSKVHDVVDQFILSKPYGILGINSEPTEQELQDAWNMNGNPFVPKKFPSPRSMRSDNTTSELATH